LNDRRESSEGKFHGFSAAQRWETNREARVAHHEAHFHVRAEILERV
jgi:hypothetical protein